MTIAIIVGIVVALVAALVLGPWGPSVRARDAVVGAARLGPHVAEFHVMDGAAMVRFDVPLPDGDIDAVLADLLIREAIEVVRDKRHSLPLGDVHRVIAYGRVADDWAEAGRVELDTPGTLPPPLVPELLPHVSHPAFDIFERMPDLPEHAPGLADRRGDDSLEPIGTLLRLPAAVEAGIRAQGLDPASAEACDLMLAVMRLAGYEVTEMGEETAEAVREGSRIMVRKVRHRSGDHPELDEPDIDRFMVDFVVSGADRGLLITEKYSPFEIYDRERREPRVRFVTRERFQSFIDALAVG